jgi:hypothetical protein
MMPVDEGLLRTTSVSGQSTLAAIRSLAWIRCLDGWMPAGLIGNVDPTSERMRKLRSHPAMLALCGLNPADRFWGAKYQFLALRSAILLNSSWIDGRPRPVPIVDLAKAAGLSLRTAHMMIDRGARTGDLVRRPDDEDARLRIIEPTESLLLRAHAQTVQWFDLMSWFTGRPNPLACWGAAATVMARRVFLELMLCTGNRPANCRRGANVLKLFLLMWDVLLEAQRKLPAFVAEEARRIGTTCVTIRHAVVRARQEGWLEQTPDLVPSAMAWQRYSNLFTVLERRWNLALDLVERSGKLQRGRSRGVWDACEAAEREVRCPAPAIPIDRCAITLRRRGDIQGERERGSQRRC